VSPYRPVPIRGPVQGVIVDDDRRPVSGKGDVEFNPIGLRLGQREGRQRVFWSVRRSAAVPKDQGRSRVKMVKQR
jgi:hypothetical protein